MASAATGELAGAATGHGARADWSRAIATALGGLLSAVLLAMVPSRLSAGVYTPDPTATPTPLEHAPPTATPISTSACPVPEPHVEIGPHPVHSGELVTVDGGGSRGTFDTVRWAQLAGPSAHITTAADLMATFIAPPVLAPTTVTIQLALYGSCSPTFFVAMADVRVLPRSGAASIAVGDVRAVPGGEAIVDVRLFTDVPTARVEHDLAFPSPLLVVAAPDGQPDCTVPPELDIESAQIAYVPDGCAGDACSGIRVALAAPTAIPDGSVLYRCRVAITDGPSESCDHLLACDDPAAYDPTDAAVAAQCVEGGVHVGYPEPPTARFVFTIEPPAPRVGDLVHITIDTLSDFPGLIGIPDYGLAGTLGYFTGGTSPRHFTGPSRVTYDLRAVQAGTAELSVGMTFEAKGGCVGHEYFYRAGASSDVVPLPIAPAECAGDCNGDGRVGIGELVTGVRMVLTALEPSACPAMDANRSGAVQIDDLIAAVAAGLLGCNR